MCRGPARAFGASSFGFVSDFVLRISSFRWVQSALPAILLVIVPVVQAQSRGPHIGYVYPAGGRQNDTFQVQIGGQYLDGANRVYVSGSGVHATVIEHIRPLTGPQLNELRQRLRELQKKETEAAVLTESAEIRAQLTADENRNIYPVLSESVTCQVTVAPNAELGERELRLQVAAGLSNPLTFCVGQLPEVREKEGKSSVADAPMGVPVPVTVNGRIVPGSTERDRLLARRYLPYLPADVDRYRFSAHQGQPLVIAASARALMPYLADAVPGWFQAAVTLYDARGKELAYADGYRFHPDPVLYYEVPEDGDYVIEIRDALYRGREDFVYRLTVGELPFVTDIFPLGCQAGKKVTLALQGWNLPTDRLTINAENTESGLYPVSVHAGNLFSNRVPFAVDALPECLEQEPNNQLGEAQAVVLPIIVNGRIDPSGDWDIFSFSAQAGAQIVAEVYARRLDSPLDSVLKLTDANGRQLAFNDDHEDRGSGLTTHGADSYLTATLPADGTYYLHVGDAQHQGGPEYAYRLRLSPPRPDFDLRIVPSAINVVAGGTAPVTVYALRKDGFSGAIALALRNAPRGYVLRGVRVPANKDRVEVALIAPALPPAEPLSLTVEGRATIGGQEIVRQAVPAEDMMQAFAYRHLVVAQDLKVVVTKRPDAPASAKALGTNPVKAPASSTARPPAVTPTRKSPGSIRPLLSRPPKRIVPDRGSDN
jgi:hypothetical protein